MKSFKINIQPDPESILRFFDHLSFMCAQHEIQNKSPRDLVLNFFDNVCPEDYIFNVEKLKSEDLSSYGSALQFIVNVYFDDQFSSRSLH